MNHQLIDVIDETTYGLKCPDGSIIWPPETYKGYPFETVEQRNGFEEILRGAALELKVEPRVWAAAFSWVPAYTTTTVVRKTTDEVFAMGCKWAEDEVAVVNGESPPPDLNG